MGFGTGLVGEMLFKTAADWGYKEGYRTGDTKEPWTSTLTLVQMNGTRPNCS